VGCMGVCG